MSWEPIAPRRGARADDVVKVAVWAKGGFVVQIGEAVLKALAWAKKGERLTVALGTGEHAGKLRVARAAKGDPSFALGAIKGGGSVKFKHPALAVEPFSAATVEHAIDRGAIILTLPEFAPIKPAKAAPAPQPPARPSAAAAPQVEQAKRTLERAGKTVTRGLKGWRIGKGEELTDSELIRAASRVGA
jgi:hypothetical protein